MSGDNFSIGIDTGAADASLNRLTSSIERLIGKLNSIGGAGSGLDRVQQSASRLQLPPEFLSKLNDLKAQLTQLSNDRLAELKRNIDQLDPKNADAMARALGEVSRVTSALRGGNVTEMARALRESEGAAAGLSGGMGKMDATLRAAAAGFLGINTSVLTAARGMADAARNSATASTGFATVGTAMREMGVAGTSIAALGIGAVLAGIGAAVGHIITPVIEATENVNHFVHALDAIGGTGFGQATFDNVTKTAMSAGVAISGLTKQAQQFAVAAQASGIPLKDMNGLFNQLVIGMRGMGAGTQQINGAMNALNQMMSKGQVQAQELKLQLGNALPGAMALAAEAVGTTTKGLEQMARTGQLLPVDFIEKFADLLATKFGGVAAANMIEVSAQLTNLNNQFTLLATSLGQGNFVGIVGGFGYALRGVNDIIALVAPSIGALLRVVGDLIGGPFALAGGVLTSFARGVNAIGLGVAYLVNHIVPAAQAIGTFVAFAGQASGITAALSSALSGVGALFSLIGQGVSEFVGAIGVMASGFASLITGTDTWKASVSVVTAIVDGLSSAIKYVVDGVTSGVNAFREWVNTSDGLAKTLDFLGNAAGSAAAALAAIYALKLADNFEAIKGSTLSLASAFRDVVANAASAAKAQIVAFGASLANMASDMRGGMTAIEAFSGAFPRLYAAIGSTASFFKAAAVEVLVFARNILTLNFSAAIAQLGALGTAIRAIGASMLALTGGWGGMILAIIAGGAAIGAAASYFGVFDNALTGSITRIKSFAQGSNGVAEGMNKIKEAAASNSEAVYKLVFGMDSASASAQRSAAVMAQYSSALAQNRSMMAATNAELNRGKIFHDNYKNGIESERLAVQEEITMLQEKNRKYQELGANTGPDMFAEKIRRLQKESRDLGYEIRESDLAFKDWENSRRESLADAEEFNRQLQENQEFLKKYGVESSEAAKEAIKLQEAIGKNGKEAGEAAQKYMFLTSSIKDQAAAAADSAKQHEENLRASLEMTKALVKAREETQRLIDEEKKSPKPNWDKIRYLTEFAAAQDGAIRQSQQYNATEAQAVVAGQAKNAVLTQGTGLNQALGQAIDNVNQKYGTQVTTTQALTTMTSSLGTATGSAGQKAQKSGGFWDNLGAAWGKVTGKANDTKVSTGELTKAAAKNAEKTDEAATSSGKFAEQMKLVDEALSPVKDKMDAIAKAVDSVGTSLDKIGTAFATAATNAATYGTALDALQGNINNLIAKMQQLIDKANEAMKASSKASGGDSTSTPQQREGGYAGDGPRASVSSSAFHNAPHFSEGTSNTSAYSHALAGGGIPSILHPNEAVIPLSRGRSIPVQFLGQQDNSAAMMTLAKGVVDGVADIANRPVQDAPARRDSAPSQATAPVLRQNAAVDYGTSAVVEKRQDSSSNSSSPSSGNIVINMTVHTPDADSFRKSKEQINTELFTKLKTAFNKNG